MKTDPDEIVPILFRIPRWMVEGLEKESAALSERAGGVPVSRNAALVSVLKRSLTERKRKAAHAVERSDSTALVKQKYQQANDKVETRISALLNEYKRLHVVGLIANTHAAKSIGVSEATIRRWLRGEATLDADKTTALEEYVANVQLSKRSQETLGLE